MTARYRLHGLVIESDLRLDAPAAAADAPVDLRVEQVRARPDDVEGELACEVAAPAGTYRGRVGSDGWSLRFEDEHAFCMRSGSDRLLAWSAGGDSGLLASLVAGNVLTFLLQLRGCAMFHASAVAISGSTIAIAGPQGAGKTTLAARLCGAGAELVTDDALRVDDEGDVLMCHAGGRTLRLRSDVEWLADVVPHEQLETTWDGRLALRPRMARVTPRPVDAFVLPVHADQTSLQRLTSKQAAVELLGLPRWYGWHLDGPQRLHLRMAAAVAERVPVYRLGLTRDAGGATERLLETLP